MMMLADRRFLCISFSMEYARTDEMYVPYDSMLFHFQMRNRVLASELVK